VTVNKSELTLTSTTKHAAVLQGNFDVADGAHNTTIEKFHITPASGDAVHVRTAGNVTVSENKITGLGPTGGVDGIVYTHTAPANAGTITGNEIEDAELAIYLDHDGLTDFTTTGNTITDNRKGIGLGSGSGGLIQNNTVTGCTQIGMEIFNTATIQNNTVTGNATGIHIGSGADHASIHINQNNITNNTAPTTGVNNAGTTTVDAENNWWGDASGPSGVGPGTGDAVSANVDYCPWLDDEFATGNAVYPIENTTISTGYCTIQAAIDAATTGQTIVVNDGTYNENLTINKNLALLSQNGRSSTTIEGISGIGSLGTIVVTNSTTGVQIGDTGQGFKVIGIDNGNPAVENAAIYFQGSHSGALIKGNEVRANGDHGFLTEYGATIDSFILTENIFSGQTFEGTNPAGEGFTQQFSLPNVPRQLVTMGGGSGGGNTSNITFTNNEITGTAGGYNGSSDAQGNTLVTLDSVTATITGNHFAGTTTRYGSSLRARGPNATITGNTFDSSGLTLSNSHLYLKNNTTDSALISSNNWDKGVWVDGGDTVGLSIQGFVNAVPNGTTINVLAGTYTEAIVIDKPLTLRGATYNVNKNGYAVPANYTWDDTVESIIQAPNPFLDGIVVDITETDNVTFEGFIVQSLYSTGTGGSGKDPHLLRINARYDSCDNIVIRNNIIGPNTNVSSQNGTLGRMGLYFALPNYDPYGITNTLVSGNKIFDVKGNGNNIFIWGAAENYGSTQLADMAGTIIEDNEIYGSHRSGIEIAGGVTGLEIKNNSIYGNTGLPSDDLAKLKYGNGILIIRMGSDKSSPTALGADGLTIEDNKIFDNEKNGIYLGPINKNHEIHGNEIYGNRWNGIVVDQEESYHGAANPIYDKTENIDVTNNNINGNMGHGAKVIGTPTNGFSLNAINNWWGDSSGPYHATLNPSGLGDEVSDNVEFDPWLFDEKDDTNSHFDNDAGDGVNTDSIPGLDSLTYNGSLPGGGPYWTNINQYDGTPPQGAPSTIGFLGHYYDIESNLPDPFTPSLTVTIVFSYTDQELADAGISEDDDLITITYWDGANWVGINRRCLGQSSKHCNSDTRPLHSVFNYCRYND